MRNKYEVGMNYVKIRNTRTIYSERTQQYKVPVDLNKSYLRRRCFDSPGSEYGTVQNS